MIRDKTVYILGAGFSMDSGAPSQAAIIQEIFELRNAYPTKYRTTVHDWVDQFDSFLKDSLLVDEANKNWYSLEDVYTPIDKSISEGTSFREYTVEQLIELRDIFNKLIILAVRNCIVRKNKGKSSIRKFAKHLVKEGKLRLKNEKDDRIAVITTNWDIMLDNLINQLINDEPIPKGHDFSGVVDYCCHISSLDENDHKVKPGLYALGKGRYNVKFLKLHGSLNWLQCPKCSRIYVKFYRKWNGGYVFDEKHCRHCERNFKTANNKSNQLMTNLVMPTYLKDFRNVQHKVIWQNAGIELSEASKVVFLGYSLPQADFELKQILSRMIRCQD
jgi:NAD-dependent SIR2 family protein deacetylase